MSKPYPKSIFDIKDDSDPAFRYKSKTIFLTYKTHIPKSTLLAFALDINRFIDHYIISHENADESAPYEHTHAMFILSGRKSYDFTNPRKWDIDDIHPHMGYVKNKERATQYLWKEDHDPLTNGKKPTNFEVTIESIMNADTDVEAVKNNANKISDITGILALRKCKRRTIFDYDRLKKKYSVKLRDWQDFMYDIIKGDLSDRSIYWLMNLSGNEGKSFFGTWLMFNDEENKTWSINFSGRPSDVYDAWVEELDTGVTPRFVIFNVSCTVDSTSFSYLYEVMEAFKDGKCFCSKYKSRPVLFWPPTILVTANIWPNLSKMREDRWHLYELTNGKLEEKSVKEVDLINHALF